MTFRKQWPQKRTEYPTSNRAKSQRQYFTAKTTAHARASDIRARHHQSPTTRSYSYRPLRPHNRMISRAPRPAAVRSPRSRPPGAAPAGRCPPDLALAPCCLPLPRDGILPGRARQQGGGLLRAPCATTSTTPIRH